MEILKAIGKWLSDEKKQKTVAFIVGVMAVLVGGIWTVFVYFGNHTLPPAHTVNIGQVTGGVVQTGKGRIFVTNIQGISEEQFQRLAEDLGVTHAALKNFFGILQQKSVPSEELDKILREIATRYNELKEKLQRVSSDDPKINTLRHQASEALKAGNFDQAEALLNQASERDVEAAKDLQEVAKKRLLSAAASKAENGDLKYAQLAYADAAAYFQEAANLVPSDAGETLAGYLNRWGVALSDAGDYKGATEPLIRALKIRKKVLGSEHLDVATSLNNLAMLYHAQGQYAKAVPILKRALDISEKALGQEHLDVATSLNNLAMLYDAQGQYAKAEPLYKRALAIREKALGLDHPDVATSINNLAMLYHAQGQYAKAEPLLKWALDIWEKALGLDHPDVATSLNNLAGL